MKKKIISLLLALFMILPYFTFISASAAEYKSSKISVYVATPAENASPASIKPNEVILAYQQKDGTAVTVDASKYSVETVWKFENAPFSGKFEMGAKYDVEILIKLSESGLFTYSMEQTVVSVNGVSDERSVKVLEAKDKEIKISYSFPAISKKDATPNPTIEVSGKTDKTYDGESVYLTVKNTNRFSDVFYKCSWYKNDIPLNTEAETIELRSASDSGKYKCTITATDNGTTLSKTTQEIKVNIAKRKLTIEIFDATKAQGEKDPDFEYTVIGGLVDGEFLTGDPEREAGEKIGSYKINKGSLALEEEYAPNYEITYQSGNLTITDPSLKYSDASAYVGDSSMIYGENNTKIKIEANIETIANGAMFAISQVSDNDKKTIESICENDDIPYILKMFSIKLVASNNQELSLKSGTAIRISIPLTEKEKSIKDDIEVVFFNPSSNRMVRQKCEIKKDSEASYIVFDSANTGSFVLISDKKPEGGAEKGEKDDDIAKKEEKKSEWWLWAIFTVIGAAAIIIGIICPFVIKPLRAELKSVKSTEDRSDNVKIFKKPYAEIKEEPKPDENEQKKISFDDLED